MCMILGSCWVNVHIPGIRSLKEKRRIIKSLKERLKNKFNISVAEIGALNQWQRAEIGIACVSNDRAFVDRLLNKIRDCILEERNISVIDFHSEII